MLTEIFETSLHRSCHNLFAVLHLWKTFSFFLSLIKGARDTFHSTLSLDKKFERNKSFKTILEFGTSFNVNLAELGHTAVKWSRASVVDAGGLWLESRSRIAGKIIFQGVSLPSKELQVPCLIWICACVGV